MTTRSWIPVITDMNRDKGHDDLKRDVSREPVNVEKSG